MGEDFNPFQSPLAEKPNYSPTAAEAIQPAASLGEFRAVRARGTVTRLLIAACLIAGLGEIGVDCMQFALIARVRAHQVIAKAEIESNDARITGASVIVLFANAIAGVTFLVWQYRAYSNLTPLGARHLNSTPGWSVGGWFIPVLSLIRPYQAIRECWLGSRTDNAPSFIIGRHESASWTVGVWWGLFLICSIGNRIFAVMDKQPNPTMDDLAVNTMLSIALTAVWIVTGILALRIVSFITNQQERRFAWLSGEPAGTF